MRALVTGACGFVGGYLVRHLAESGDKVCATMLATTLKLPAVESKVLDVCDSAACHEALKSFAPEVVYHLAGLAFPPDAEKDFSRTLAINVGGTYNVIEACHKLGTKIRVVLVSSAQVYGKSSAEEQPLVETTAIRPADAYSLSKVMTENVALKFAADRNLSIVTMRPFNHIGAGQRQDFVVSNFAYQLARIAKGKHEPIIKIGNLTSKRDFTDVRDIARGYRLAALKGQGIYNLCSGSPVSIREILDRLIAISGLSVTIEEDPSRMRASDTPVLYGSYEKAKAELGWKPEYSLETSLRDSYTYWMASEAL